MNRFLSPNLWAGIFSILGVVGVAIAVLGTALGQAYVKTIGFVLISPIVILGIMLVVVGFPILIVANSRHHKDSQDDYDRHRNDVQPK